MNILDAILNAQDGAAVRQLGTQVGLAPDQTAAALSALVPALAGGFQRNIQSQGGLESLMSALSSGNHRQYIDNPTSLADHTAVTDGNGILGHLLGSKDVSREVASRAAAQTGLSADVLKRMLPLAATLMMGAFSKQSGNANASSMTAALGGSGTGIAAMLTPLLDQNRDGSIIDDVTSMIGRFAKPSQSAPDVREEDVDVRRPGMRNQRDVGEKF
ncbi:MAG: DUF937 domain-containing protein [Acidobacteria bacterium]|nr:DUF937 domain-containing protein [Acidobacteriota bacterium]